MSKLQVYGAAEIEDALTFISKTRKPSVRVKPGGQALVVNHDLVTARLAQMYPDPKRALAMYGWGNRWIPVLDNPDAYVVTVNRAGVAANSLLDKREWSELDREIFEMVKLRQNAVQDLIDRNLTKRSSLAVMLSQWRMATERTRPSVNMDGRSRANRDLTDRLVFSVPIPIIRADYEIGSRELLASRTLGTPIDTFEAGEAVSAVVEEQERMLFNGDTSIVVQGSTISGYTTLAARDTNTAAGYGGGDFGTISNIRPTFLGMKSALNAVRYHGPFVCYVANTQYNQMLERFSDGSGQTALESVEEIPSIDAVRPSDFLADGAVVMVQMTKNVVDLEIAQDVEQHEWESGDGQALYFAVMAASAPRLKTDSDGNAGVAHATAA
jgi:uncharacterized linocin/CFP29 family protein